MVAPVDIRAGNLHGEERWERQALESLVGSGDFSVKTTMSKCEFPNVGVITNSDEARNTVLLIQDFSPEIIMKYKWKGVIINIFSEPTLDNLNFVRDLKKEYKNKIIFTYSFKHSTRSMGILREQRVGKDFLYHLPCPAAPYIYEGNNFDKKILLMPYRALLHCFPEVPCTPTFMSYALEWLGGIIDEFKDHSVYFLTGYHPREASVQHIENLIYDSSYSVLLKKNRNRVKVFSGMGWSQVLDIYKNTKLMCTNAFGFGGPPIESGMHGIPFVGRFADVGPLVGSPDYLSADTGEQTVIYLDKLFRDREFYTRIGNSYREYVRQTYTYTKFAKNFSRLLLERGMV